MLSPEEKSLWVGLKELVVVEYDDIELKMKEFIVRIESIPQERRKPLVCYSTSQEPPVDRLNVIRRQSCRGTLLHDAAYFADDDLIAVLLKYGANPIQFSFTHHPRTPMQELFVKYSERAKMHWFSEDRAFRCIKLMLEETSNGLSGLNIHDSKNANTLLHSVIYFDLFIVAQYLIDCGALMNIKNRYGETAKDLAKVKNFHFQTPITL